MGNKKELVFTPKLRDVKPSPHMGPVIVAGEGSRTAPQLKDLGKRTIEKARAGKIKVKKVRGHKRDIALGGIPWGTDWDPTPSGLYIRRRNPRIINPNNRSAGYLTVVDGAQTIADLLREARFDDAEYMLFQDSNIQPAADEAAAKLTGFGNAFVDHKVTVAEFRKQVTEALPTILDTLMQQHPDVSVSELENAALQALLEEAGELIDVLRLTTSVIQQYLRNEDPQLRDALNGVMLEFFHLSQGYDLEKVCAGEHADPIVPLSWFHIGDKILTALLGGGLGVIPGGKLKGALGVHLLMFQRDMRRWPAQAMALLAHEDEHIIDNDRPGFLSEASKVLFDRVVDAVKSGKVKVSSKVYEFGESEADAALVLASCAVNRLQEDFADAGGVRKIGGSFYKAMVMSFPALSIRRGRIADAQQLLRTGSVYMLKRLRSGEVVPVFEPHTPDAARVLQVVQHLRAMSRNAEADEKEAHARELIGKADMITWKAADERWSTPDIQIPLKDLEAIMPIVSDVAMNHPFKSLGGRSKLSIVNFYGAHGGKDPDVRWRKVRAGADNLLAGLSNPPKGVDHFFKILAVAAATEAFWDAAAKRRSAAFNSSLQENFLAMIEKADRSCRKCCVA